MKMLSLDPATHYTGYALWEQISIETQKPVFQLVRYGVMKARQDAWDYRCLEINSKIRNLIVKENLHFCVSEFPQFQAGRRGMDAAMAGDTLKLAYLCGSISTGWQLHVAEQMKKLRKSVESVRNEELLPFVEWYTPSQWKGQLPKELTAQRCYAKYGFLARTEIDRNISDAIMIGDFWLKQKGLTHIEGHPERMDP
jgi:hypothetical protein